MDEKTKMPGGAPSSDSKLMGAISYLWIISVVMLIVKKDDPFVKFHARQGLILFIVSIILWFIPVIGWIINLLVLILIIVGFIKALSGEKWKIPLVGDIAEKINL